MKVFITKHALTRGIVEIEVERSKEAPNMVTWKGGYGFYSAHGEGKEWHLTKESAVKRAEQMRRNKIASLEKQRAKLMTFTFDL